MRLTPGLLVIVTSAVLACGGVSSKRGESAGSADGTGDTGGGSGGTGGGDGGPSGTGSSDGGPTGTGGTTESASCTAFNLTTDLHASCELAVQSCPRTLDELLESIEANPGFLAYVVYESGGLREVSREGGFSGSSFLFTEDGELAGWVAASDVPWGPCQSSGQWVYQRGRRMLSAEPPSVAVHRCDLAADALETGILCDCPCPDEPPSDGVYRGDAACLSVGWWPGPCAPTFSEQYEVASTTADTSMRSGCGIRTLTLLSLDCSYDDAGNFVGGRRPRGTDPRDLCPGVDAYVAGDVPTCDDESICYFLIPPEGSMLCPWEG